MYKPNQTPIDLAECIVDNASLFPNAVLRKLPYVIHNYFSPNERHLINSISYLLDFKHKSSRFDLLSTEGDLLPTYLDYEDYLKYNRSYFEFLCNFKNFKRCIKDVCKETLSMCTVPSGYYMMYPSLFNLSTLLASNENYDKKFFETLTDKYANEDTSDLYDMFYRHSNSLLDVLQYFDQLPNWDWKRRFIFSKAIPFQVMLDTGISFSPRDLIVGSYGIPDARLNELIDEVLAKPIDYLNNLERFKVCKNHINIQPETKVKLSRLFFSEKEK